MERREQETDKRIAEAEQRERDQEKKRLELEIREREVLLNSKLNLN